MNSFKKIEKYAMENNIPIVEEDGLEVLLEYVGIVKPKTILEVGTAIGYSALKMNSVCNSKVVTFEREKYLVDIALENIS